MSDKDQFDGDGYDQSEFTPRERAGIRQMWRVLSQDYVRLTEENAATVDSITSMGKSVLLAVKIIGAGAVIGGAAAAYIQLVGGAS